MAFEAVPADDFEDFVRGYGAKAFQFAFRLCGSVEEAKELVQAAFTRLLERWGEHDPTRSREVWFRAILHNTAVDAIRRQQRRQVVSLDALVEGGDGEETYAEIVPRQEDAMLEGLERRGLQDAVRRALDRLNAEHRTVLMLCDVEGRTYEEIAEILDAPLGTVRSRVSRARLAFRRRLAPFLEVMS